MVVMFMLDKFIIIYRRMIYCLSPSHFLLRKEWLTYARYLEAEFFPKLFNEDIETVDIDVREDTLFPEASHKFLTGLHFPNSANIAERMSSWGIKRLRLDVRLESNQIVDVLNLFCRIGSDLSGIQQGRKIYQREMISQLTSTEGLKRYCTQIRIVGNYTGIEIDYSYCQLTFSKVITHLKKLGKLFKDHRWFFYAAPRFSIIVGLLIFSLPVVLRYFFPGFGLIALIITSFLIAGLTYVVFQTIGSIEYDKEEQAQQIRRINHDLQERERMINQDLEKAASIQKHLLPSENVQVGVFSVAAGLKPQAKVGGDFYDIRRRENGDTELILVDSVGHGLSASLVSIAVKSIFSQTQYQGVALIHHINTALKQLLPSGFFAAITYISIPVQNGHLQYLNAGNPFPLLLSTEGRVRALSDAAVPPMGVAPFPEDKDLACGKVELKKSESLVLFTDGIIEALNEEGEEYGVERMINVLDKNVLQGAQDMRDKILQDTFIFADQASQHDDQTVVVIQRIS